MSMLSSFLGACQPTVIDVSNYQSGVYGVILVADGQMVDEIGLVVTH